jgi:hypothetical protein
MNATAIIFFLFGATVLWGGFGVTLAIAMKKEKQSKQ